MSRDGGRILVLDTTYLLPAFGIEIELDSAGKIESTLEELTKDQDATIYISDLSPLEAFLKSFRLAEKERSDQGKKAAKMGFLAVTRETSMLTSIPHSEEGVLNEACEIRNTHNDPFDCFIFATAKMLGALLVTEDNDATKYLGSQNVLSWRALKKSLRSRKAG